MKKLMAIAFIVASMLSGVAAEEGSAFVPYSDALTKCSAEWKASDQRAKTPKGEGSKAWNAFRAECVTRQGYVKGRKAPTQGS